LQEQGQCLQQKFGVSSQISSLLRQMWLSLLPSTKLLEPQLHTLQPERGYLWLGNRSRMSTVKVRGMSSCNLCAVGLQGSAVNG
jgi:hypothetical protein